MSERFYLDIEPEALEDIQKAIHYSFLSSQKLSVLKQYSVLMKTLINGKKEKRINPIVVN